MNDIDEALKDFFFALSKSIGIIYLVKHVWFLELKDWVKERELKYDEKD